MTENTQTAAPTATTQAPAPEKPAAVTTPAPEAPSKAAPVAEAKPEAAPKVAEKPTQSPTGEKKAAPKPEDFYRAREEKREKKAQERLAELEKEHNALKAQLEAARTQEQAPKEEPISFLDDPDKALFKAKEDAKREVFAELEARERKARAEAEYRQEAQKAASWLLTRSHLTEDPAFKEEVANKVDGELAELWAKYPNEAAELAYVRVCQSKGIIPDMEGFKSAGFDATQGRATVGASPSAPASGKRVFAKGEAKAYLREVNPGTPEHAARMAEVDEAYREGRVQR